MERFGVALRKLREEKGLTQKEMAVLFGVNRATISHYEGNLSYPTADILVNMANFFHISVDRLLGRTDGAAELLEGLTDEQIQSVKEIIRQYRLLNGVSLDSKKRN